MSEREQIIKSMEETRKQMAILSDLLTKDQERLEAVLEAGPWKPKVGEKFYSLNLVGEPTPMTWYGCSIDDAIHAFGNCFPTELEAKRHAAKMKFMFRRCPEIGHGETYFTIEPESSIGRWQNSNSSHWSLKVPLGVFKTKEEAEEWLPLYKFAFLGGDCPEGF